MRSTRHLAALAIAWGALIAASGHAMPAPGDENPTDPAVIDNTGAARHRIPIEVPPGPGGFAPRLALSYSSRSGDGPFGVGWSLGIPEIRCSDRFGVPNYASCLKYELGSDILVPDPDLEKPNEYHTFVESFQRIRFDPLNNLWTVEQPSGTKLVFGGPATHRILQGSSTARWLLERMEDAFGNKVFFIYNSPTAFSNYDPALDSSSAYLTNVFYGANASSSSGPREVRFHYGARPDQRQVYASGIARNMRHRLREIQVFGHSLLFKRYAFGYDGLSGVAYTTDRSRLSWVQEFGTDCGNLNADPVTTCTGLPRHEFRYRNAPGSYDSSDEYRIPFGAYAYDPYPPGLYPNLKYRMLQIIGDINGDGLPDRLELLPDPLDNGTAGTVRVLLNTGSGFSATGQLAQNYQASFAGLKYQQPWLQYTQIPVPHPPNPTVNNVYYFMYAMCSVTTGNRPAVLSQELLPRGVGAAASSLHDLNESEGAPSAGFIQPRPTVKLVDVNADGLADLVLSVRVSGVDRNFNCNGTQLSQPEHFEEQTAAVVFRNTGNGWENDPVLASGLPPFEELIVKSSYQTELDEPTVQLSSYNGDSALSPCENHGYFGFEFFSLVDQSGPEYMPSQVTTVCHVPIDLSPQFADFNGDGLLDLAVIERDNRDLLWTGHDPFSLTPSLPEGGNDAPTHVWIQKRGGPQRWVRAQQYDLPLGIFEAPSYYPPRGSFAHVWLFHDAYAYFAPPCHPTSVEFWQCGPSTHVTDLGVRLADMNRDGLVDVVWNRGEEKGALLNRGDGSGASAAWCASKSDDAPLVGGGCPEASIYVPPASFLSYSDVWGNAIDLPIVVGWLSDLSGDGLPDFVRVQTNGPVEAWIQSPSGTTMSTRWLRKTDFDFPGFPGEESSHTGWYTQIQDPVYGGTVSNQQTSAGFIPGFAIFDVDGDGSADFVGDQHVYLSRSRHADLLESIENGRGGKIEFTYEPANQEEVSSPALEDAANEDVQPQTPEGGDAIPSRARAVVSSIRVSGDGLAPAVALAVTQYRYAHPRYCSVFRSDLGFRLVERTRPDNSKVEEYFYQDHGRAGHTSRRLLFDGGQVVHRYQATWEIAPAVAGVFNGRLASEESASQYSGTPGATLTREFLYNDTHGYNFVRQIRTERPTGTLIDTRVPVSLPETEIPAGEYVLGRVYQRTLTDGLVLLRDTRFTYFDLDNDSTGPKIGSRSDYVTELGGDHAAWVETKKLRYDAHGNLTEEQTPSPAPGGGMRSTLLCYDGDSCSFAPGLAPGQTSHSVLVASKEDPLAKVTRITRDPGSGIAIGVDFDYTDVPDRRITLDPFGRPEFEYGTPTGGSEELLARNDYHDDANNPLRVERFEYVKGDESDWIYSAEVLDSFGSVWKTIAKTPSGYAGTVNFRDPTARLTRITLPLDCDGDATCGSFSGASQPAAREVTGDALGRPVSIQTPDGTSTLTYRSVANRWQGPGSLDAVLERNAKGDLTERALDGDRVVWVDECNGAGPECTAADTTRYTYLATGEVAAIHDPRAVATGNFTDPDHRLAYGYDSLGRVVWIADPDLGGAGGAGSSRTVYNEGGSLASTTNARGQMRFYQFDGLGRLVGIDAPEGEDDYTVEYRPNEWQRKRDFSAAYERLYTYDGWGRVAQTRLSVLEPEGPAEWDGWSGIYFMDFEFDLAGRPAQVKYPESTVVRYEYAGAYLKKVCDLGEDSDACPEDPMDTSVVQYVSDVIYDEFGRRQTTKTAAGTRTFEYAGSLPRLTQDRFDATPGSPSPYWLELNYDAYDELGNLTAMTGISQPGDIDLDQEFTYDRRNRLASWTRPNGTQSVTSSYGYDEIGNLTNNAGSAQVFSDPARPHAIQRRAGGSVTYTHDADGNVTSIVGGGANRYFQFDSANRMVCADATQGGCALNRVHYDVGGRRVLDDDPQGMKFTAFPDDTVSLDGGLSPGTRIEIWAFGERIAYKSAGGDFRTAGGFGGASWGLPPSGIGLIAAVGLLGLIAWARQRGALVLVIQRPAYAGVSAVLVVLLVLGPLPGARVSKAGGGGGANFYWELTDPLGTGMVMLDETGARQVHRTYSPFGVEQDSVGTASWLPRHFAGHRKDEDSGLLYMQARWMDARSGTFLSVDPVVAGAADPQVFNAYAYARNNPVSYVDPTGEWTEWWSWVMGGGWFPDLGYAPGGVPAYSTSINPEGSILSDLATLSSAGGPSTVVAFEPGPGSAIASGAETAFRWLIYDYEEPLGGSYLLEAATLIPIGKVAKGGKLLERGITVLGHHPQYLEKAAELGARYFDVPLDVWERMSDAERWAANLKFLDRAIARGDEFILATKASAARAGSYFAREVEYLASKGYRVAEDGWRLIAPGN